MITNLLGHEFVSSLPEYAMTTIHFQQLDHCFVKNLRTKKAEVVESPGSDHYPIYIELELV